MDAVCKEKRSMQDNRISPFAKPVESPLTLRLMNNKTCKALRNLELPVHTGKLESVRKLFKVILNNFHYVT